jgi:hypothetical protein
MRWGNLSIPFPIIAPVIFTLFTLRGLLLSSDSPSMKRSLRAYEPSMVLSPAAAGKG